MKHSTFNVEDKKYECIDEALNPSFLKILYLLVFCKEGSGLTLGVLLETNAPGPLAYINVVKGLESEDNLFPPSLSSVRPEIYSDLNQT